MRRRANFVGQVTRRHLLGRGRYVACWIVIGACATCTRSALAQAPAPPADSAQPMTARTTNLPVPPPPATQLTDPSSAFCPPNQGTYQAALTAPADSYPYPCIDFFGVGTVGPFPWSSSAQTDLIMRPGEAAAYGVNPPSNFNLLSAGPNRNTRVVASSSPAETHAPGHATKPEQTGYALNGSYAAFNTNISFDVNPTARAAVIEDTTRLGPASAGGFVPSSIPVEGQPFFGTPAHTSVQGSGSTLNVSATATPAPSPTYDGANDSFLRTLGIHSISAYGVIEAQTYDSQNAPAATASVQQAFIQIDGMAFGIMETAFADNDALPPTLDLAGPNARVTVFATGNTVMGAARLSYWLHQMPTNQASFGYAINASVEQPSPEIAANASPAKGPGMATFARFPDFIGTFKIGQMLEAPDDVAAGTDPAKAQYYEAWHLQAGGLARSLGLESSNDSIDEAAFGWGVSLSGHYSWHVPCTILPDAVYGSVTYGVGIAHYISDLHTLATSAATAGNDAVLDGTYLRPLAELGYYAGYLHNWSDHWRSVVAYSHVTLDSQGQANKQLYRFGDYVSASLEWHRILQVVDPTKQTTGPSQYGFNLGLEYLYGRFEELSGAAGQDQRIGLVATIYK
jgi:hypothetical protein